MPEKKYGLGYRREIHPCPYCGKPIFIKISSFGDIEVYRGDVPEEIQTAEKKLRIREQEEAVKKTERRKLY